MITDNWPKNVATCLPIARYLHKDGKIFSRLAKLTKSSIFQTDFLGLKTSLDSKLQKNIQLFNYFSVVKKYFNKNYLFFALKISLCFKQFYINLQYIGT